MSCPKCQGMTVPEEDFAWRCVMCGKRGAPVDSQEVVVSCQRYLERVRVDEDQNWLQFWKRRRLKKGYGDL